MRFVRLVVALLCLLPLPGLLEALSPLSNGDEARVSWRGRAHFRSMQAAFAEDCPVPVLLTDDGAIIPLSFVGMGLMSMHASGVDDAELTDLVDRVVDCARSRHPVDLARPSTWGDHNLYLSHLALLLGIQEAITGRTDDAQHTAVVKHLRQRSLADGDFHALSYPHCCKWPADQSVTLNALALYDREHGTSLSTVPIRGWLDWMDDGLHASAVTKSLWYHDVPRGCALSWTAFHMAQFAPDAGRRLWEKYREAFYVDVGGAGGLAEWPNRASTPMDFDTGPIVFGLGTAATGIGLAPARAYGDTEVYSGILRSSLVFGLPWGLRSRDSLVSPYLPDAILFHGATATAWFDRVPPLGGSASWPILPLGLLGLDLLVLGACVRPAFAQVCVLMASTRRQIFYLFRVASS